MVEVKGRGDGEDMTMHQPVTTRSRSVEASITEGQGVAPPNSPEAFEICRRFYEKHWAKQDRRVDLRLAGSPAPKRGKTRTEEER